MIEVKKVKKKQENVEEEPPMELNVFKYELFKMCLERVIFDQGEIDEDMGIVNSNSLSMSFKLAYNTLYENQIIVEHEEYE